MADQIPGLREERKQRTRRALLDAALALLEDGRGFANVSLREVTRAAGIVPTAFYRHFDDMNELGLALVDEAFRTLRQLMRTARAAPMPPRQAIRGSVQTFVAFVRANRPHVALIARERAGGSPALRAAIRAEVRLFASELAIDLGRMPLLGAWSTDDLQMMAGLLVAAMTSGMLDVLDLPPGDAAAEAALVRVLEKQLRLVVLGAGQWRTP